LVYIGRKSIIQRFQSSGMLSDTVSHENAWRIILRWRSRYAGLDEIFHHLPNGKPVVYETEFMVWIGSGRKKLAKSKRLVCEVS